MQSKHIVLLNLFIAVVFGSGCTFTDSTTGYVYDLSGLYSLADYKIVVALNGFVGPHLLFRLNMCGAVHSTDCPTGSAVCMKWTDQQEACTVGYANLMRIQMGYQLDGSYGLTAFFAGPPPYSCSQWNITEELFVQYDFKCGAVNVLPTYIGGAGVPNSMGNIFYFLWESPLACPVDPCEQSTSCNTCTNQKCVWCLDQLACHSKTNVTDCAGIVSNPSYCPSSCASMSNCFACTNQPNKCEWCLTSNTCIPNSNGVQCDNVIKNSAYCPRSVTFN